MKTLAVTGLLVALCAPAYALAAEEGGGEKADKADKGDKEAGSGDDMGIMERFFPFGLADDVSAPIDEIMLPIVLINLLPAGGLWGPLLFLEEENRPKFNNDILISYLVPALSGWGVAVVGGCVIGGVCGLVTGGFGSICGLIGCVGIIPYLWNAPIASLNAWDRAYKNPNAGDKPKSHAKNKSKGEPKSDAKPKATPPDKSTGNEPYGY
jgi:hypothetical protein